MADIFTQPTDQDALRLTHAIALQESGSGGKPNYNAVGDNGTSHGAYQWQPGNFESAAKEAGLDPTDMSPENQDKVAYFEVKKYKDQGYDPGQIASLWNSGSPNNYKDHSGDTVINGKTIHYDTPAYVNGVKSHYQQLLGSQQATYNPTPFSNPSGAGAIDFSGTQTANSTEQTPQDNLGGDLTKRGTDLGNALGVGGQALTSLASGDVLGAAAHGVSATLQGAGAIAGGVGDIVNRGLEFVPGVKQVENLLGQGVGALANTPTGQAVAKSISDWSNANPELAKDVGAGFNIVTAIPILRGLGVAGSIAKDAAAQALKGVAEKSFIEGAPELMSRTAAGSRFIAENPDVTKDMVDRRLVGNIVGGRYTSTNAINQSWGTVGDLNKQVDSILARPEFSQVSQDGKAIAQKAIQGFTDRNGNVIEGIPESRMTPEELIANAKKLDPNNAALWEKFEAGQANLQEINKLRSSLDRKVKKVYIGQTSLDAPEVATSKENGALLSSAMREAVQTGAPSTAVPFKEMATQFKIQKALGYLNRQRIEPGSLARLAGHAAGIGTGGAIGGLIGGPTGAFIGGMIGDRAAGNVANRLAGKNIIQGILKRTGVNTAKPPLIPGLVKAGGLVGGVGAQRFNR